VSHIKNCFLIFRKSPCHQPVTPPPAGLHPKTKFSPFTPRFSPPIFIFLNSLSRQSHFKIAVSHFYSKVYSFSRYIVGRFLPRCYRTDLDFFILYISFVFIIFNHGLTDVGPSRSTVSHGPLLIEPQKQGKENLARTKLFLHHILLAQRPQTQAYSPLAFVITSTRASHNFRFITSKAAWSTFSVGLVGPNQPQLYLSRRCLICTAAPSISSSEHATPTQTFQRE
jgi:hypothetical protein